MSERSIPYWEEGACSPGVFINYRYMDLGTAAHIDALLCPKYGSHNVFRANRSLRPNEPYDSVLAAAAGRAAVMLVLVGQDWRESLAAGRHNWVFVEMNIADENNVPLLPVLLTRVHNEHDERRLWTPVERVHEDISTPDELPPGVPRSLLLDRRVTFGDQNPEGDARTIIGAINGIIARSLSN